MLSVHTVFKVLARCARDALLGFLQKVRPFAEDHGVCRTHLGAGRLLIFLQALIEAELALHDLRVPLVPLELWHIERTADLTIAASDTQRAIPGNGAPCVLLQCAKGATRNARGIQAVHTLPLHEGEAVSVLFAIQLNNVLGLGVKIGWNIPQAGQDCRVNRA